MREYKKASLSTDIQNPGDPDDDSKHNKDSTSHTSHTSLSQGVEGIPSNGCNSKNSPDVSKFNDCINYIYGKNNVSKFNGISGLIGGTVMLIRP